MKLLFLDMDSVVNCHSLERKWRDDWKQLNGDNHTALRQAFDAAFCNYTELVFPELAARVTRIVAETGCKIVWSSSWRELKKYAKIEDAREMFNKRDLPGDALLGYTPVMNLRSSRLYVPRIDEIMAYLKEYNKRNKDKVTKAAIIDDDLDASTERSDNAPKYLKYFQTYDDYGLTEKITKEVIKWLS